MEGCPALQLWLGEDPPPKSHFSPIGRPGVSKGPQGNDLGGLVDVMLPPQRPGPPPGLQRVAGNEGDGESGYAPSQNFPPLGEEHCDRRRYGETRLDIKGDHGQKPVLAGERASRSCATPPNQQEEPARSWTASMASHVKTFLACSVLAFVTAHAAQRGPVRDTFMRQTTSSPVVHVKNGSYEGLYSSEYDQDFFLGMRYAKVYLSIFLFTHAFSFSPYFVSTQVMPWPGGHVLTFPSLQSASNSPNPWTRYSTAPHSRRKLTLLTVLDMAATTPATRSLKTVST